jgi:hypothetical protein
MKVYELLKKEYEGKSFTDGVSTFNVLKSSGGTLHLYLEGANDPYKFTARDILDLDFKIKLQPINFSEAILSGKDIYIKHEKYNKYIDKYLPLNRVLKEIADFEPVIVKDIFVNGEWFISE